MFVFLNIVYAFLGKYGRLGETLKNQSVSSKNIETLDEPLLSGNLKAKKKSTTTLDTPRETKEHEDYEKKPKKGPKSHDESNSIFYKQPKLIDREQPSNRNMDIDGGDTLYHVENKMQKKYDSDGMAQNFSDDSSSIESTYQEYEHEPRHPNAFSDAIRSQSARKSYGNYRDTATDDNYRSKRRMRNRRKDRVRKNRSKSQTQYGKPAGIRNNDSYEIDRFDEVGINDEPLDIELSATYQAYTADRDVPENLDDLDIASELDGNCNDGLVDKSVAQRRPKNRLGKGRVTTDIIPEYREYPTPHRKSTCAEIEDGMIPDNNGMKPKIKKIVVPGKPREVCIVKVIPIPIDKDGHPLNRAPV